MEASKSIKLIEMHLMWLVTIKKKGEREKKKTEEEGRKGKKISHLVALCSPRSCDHKRRVQRGAPRELCATRRVNNTFPVFFT